ncbi:hypothetical protein C4B60_07090 [Jeotgalibacillus proteolyticus]|uniref:Uncharacterized protein n=1 Tax=Jeotgalibacillus proteolyticus TaxID=2082395 RepID=A0A2S5GCE1_9BACL|nr:hypothetical protein C4B60_07090 [Jeotgalibacillus proteolyticus]
MIKKRFYSLISCFRRTKQVTQKLIEVEGADSCGKKRELEIHLRRKLAQAPSRGKHAPATEINTPHLKERVNKRSNIKER